LRVRIGGKKKKGKIHRGRRWRSFWNHVCVHRLCVCMSVYLRF
jgi:hypothetical protein